MKVTVEFELKDLMVFLADLEDARDTLDSWECFHGKRGNVAYNVDDRLFMSLRGLIAAADDMGLTNMKD